MDVGVNDNGTGESCLSNDTTKAEEDECVDSSTKEEQVSNGTNDEKPTPKITFKKPTLNSSGKHDAAKGLSATSKQESKPEEPLPTDGKSLSQETKKFARRSPAERLKDQSIPLPYKEPPWGGLSSKQYNLEVLKSGVLINNIPLSEKSFYTVGRLDVCDLSLDHPSISRYHALFQHRVDDQPGLFIYDLGSTHGTTLNKLGLIPKTFYRLKVGHVIKFGGSTRMFIVQGPEDEEEPETEETVTELIQKRKAKLQKLETGEMEEEDRTRDPDEPKKTEDEDSGVNWGMGEDADEATDLSENPFALGANEELYVEDPKKTLRGWFEREGHELQYQVEEKGFAQFLCRIDLPVDVVSSGTLTAEALVKGKKKEAVVQCALEACRLLDQYGLLRQANHESKKRKKRDWGENDYYDSDEDNFLDRTGAVERKRKNRMMQAGIIKPKAETYDSLKEQLEEIGPQIKKLEEDLEKASRCPVEDSQESAEDVDALDAYMTSLKSSNPLDNRSKANLKIRLNELRKEEAKLKKLVELTKPALPPMKMAPAKSKPLPMIGPRKGRGLGSLRKVEPAKEACTSTQKSSLSETNSDMKSPTPQPPSPSSSSREKQPVYGKSNKMSISIKGPFLPPEVEAALKQRKDDDEPEEESKQTTSRTGMDIAAEQMDPEAGKTGTEAGKTDTATGKTDTATGKTDTAAESSKDVEAESNDRHTDKMPNERTSIASEDNEGTVETSTDKDDMMDKETVSKETRDFEFVSESKAEGTKRKRQRQRNRKEDQKKRSNVKYDSSDPNYDVWVPPVNQSGDGRTSLNEKLGY